MPSTETADTRAPQADGHTPPEALRRTSLSMSPLCFWALGRPDLDDNWRSLQSNEAFETVRNRLCSILTSTITTASVLIGTSSIFVSAGSPVPYFDYSLPAPRCLLFTSLMLAMIAMLTSVSSIIHWLHTDRHWIQEAATLYCPTCCQ
ncbi:hypothetical protein BDR04DRAFT_1098198 [Suillus decipiens]|nr:hypothetical protein BDR04DRAFT_1098198 [Suillus decipiens]